MHIYININGVEAIIKYGIDIRDEKFCRVNVNHNISGTEGNVNTRGRAHKVIMRWM